MVTCLSKNFAGGSDEGHVVVPVPRVKIISRTSEPNYLFINVSSHLIKWSDSGYKGRTRGSPAVSRVLSYALNKSKDLCRERLLQANSSCENFQKLQRGGWLWN